MVVVAPAAWHHGRANRSTRHFAAWGGRLAACLLLTVCTLPLQAQDAAGWGTVRGRLVLDGPVPEPLPLDITRDEDVCGDLQLVDESLVVQPQNLGIRYVAVWLDSRDKVPVHPDLQALPEKPPVLDNRNCRFEPRMLALRTGQTLAISNSDPIAHNAAVFARRNQPFSEIIPMNQPLLKSFPRPELLPIRVDCSIHAWMKAWLVIQDHPYVAVTDVDGRFELRHVPAGKWKFRFWHERPGNLTQLRQQAAIITLDKGAWELTVAPSDTLDLGDLQVSAAQLAAKK